MGDSQMCGCRPSSMPRQRIIRPRVTDTVSLKLNGQRFATYTGLNSSGAASWTNKSNAVRARQTWNSYDAAGNLDWTLSDLGTPNAATDDIFTNYTYDGLDRLKSE